MIWESFEILLAKIEYTLIEFMALKTKRESKEGSVHHSTQISALSEAVETYKTNKRKEL